MFTFTLISLLPLYSYLFYVLISYGAAAQCGTGPTSFLRFLYHT